MNENMLKKLLNFKSKEETNDYMVSLYAYLENDARKKAAIIITKQQYAILSGNDDDFEHVQLGNILLDSINEKQTDTYISSDDVISVFVGCNDVVVNLPKSGEISGKQLSTLEEIVYYVEAYNRDYKAGKYEREHEIKISSGDNIEIKYDYYKNSVIEIFQQLQKYVVEPKYLYNEIIIGRDLFTKEERADFIMQTIANNTDVKNSDSVIKS